MNNQYTYDVTMFRDTFESRFTYLNGFLRNVSRFSTRPALNDPISGRRWTYAELNAEANRLAHALRANGVGKNDVVMFALLNSPEFVFCYLAAHKIGAIACPVNYRQGAGEIALVIAPPSEDEEAGIVPVGAAAADPDEALREDIRAALEEGEPASAVAKRLSQKYSRRKRDVYAMVLDMQ